MCVCVCVCRKCIDWQVGLSHLFAVDDRVVSVRGSDLSKAVPCFTVSHNVASQTSRDESSIVAKGVYIPGRDIVRICCRGVTVPRWRTCSGRTLGVASGTNAGFWLSARMIVLLKHDVFNNTGNSEIVMPSEVRGTEQCHCNVEDSPLLGYGAASVRNWDTDVSEERSAIETSL